MPKQRKRIRIVVAVALGVSCAVGACSATKTPVHALSGSNGTGTVGTNGLRPSVYKDFHGHLAKAMDKRFPAGPLQNEEHWKEIYKNPTEGPNFVEFVRRCAFRQGGKGCSPSGAGILRDDSIYDNWLKGSLTPAEKEDIHTCLATLMNEREGICVWMEGDDIQPGGFDRALYPVVEAYWATTVSSGSDADATVYYFPAELGAEKNPAEVNERLLADFLARIYERGRICHENPQGCPLKVVQKGHCEKSGKYGWKCTSDEPKLPNEFAHAVQTRLGCCDVCPSGRYEGLFAGTANPLPEVCEKQCAACATEPPPKDCKGKP